METQFQANVITFLLNQIMVEEVDLSEFQMWTSNEFMPALYKILLEKNTIKKLGVNDNGLPQKLPRYNDALEVLKVSNYYEQGSYLNSKWTTLPKLRALQELSIEFPDAQVADIIANIVGLENLTILKLSKLFSFGREIEAFQAIDNAHLKELHLSNIFVSRTDWISICTPHRESMSRQICFGRRFGWTCLRVEGFEGAEIWSRLVLARNFLEIRQLLEFGVDSR